MLTVPEPETVPGIILNVQQPACTMNRQNLFDAIAAQPETFRAATGHLLDILIRVIQSEGPEATW